MLASGTVIDTAQPDADAAFVQAEPDLAQGLLELRAELLADQALTDRVRHKFTIRNTTGYQFDALLDAETPLEMLARLGLGASDVISKTVGVRALTGLTGAVRMAISKDLVPPVPGPMLHKSPRRLPETARLGAAVYFPACVNRIFGRAPGRTRLPARPTSTRIRPRSTCRRTGPARWDCSRPPASRTSRSCSRWSS